MKNKNMKSKKAKNKMKCQECKKMIPTTTTGGKLTCGQCMAKLLFG